MSDFQLKYLKINNRYQAFRKMLRVDVMPLAERGKR